eukprot:15445208-Alexandrium_andersonii.AAC.1
MAPRVRTWNCVGPEKDLTSLPGATEGWIKRRRCPRGVASATNSQGFGTCSSSKLPKSGSRLNAQ